MDTGIKVICILLLFMRCGGSDEEQRTFILPDNAEELLAGDSSRSWKLARRFNNSTRMNMGDCFLSYRQTYLRNYQMHDNNGEQRDCGVSLKARWKFSQDKQGNAYVKLESEQLPELMGIDKTRKYFKLLSLNGEEMILQFYHKQFSDQKSVITDIYVRNDIKVGDRDFHW